MKPNQFVKALAFLMFYSAATNLLFAAPVNIAVDFDSTDARVGGSTVITTQPGFTSVNLVRPNQDAIFSSFAIEGISFDLWGLRPWPFLDGYTNAFGGSRNRGVGDGSAYDDLLQDFAFAEVGDGVYLYLRISGLPVGSYQMTSWHFDSLLLNLPDENFMQIEVANQPGSNMSLSGTVLIDHFPLSPVAKTFGFEVTTAGQNKEIFFRDDTATFGTTKRARLNGFILASVPEPACGVMLLPAMLCALRCRSRGR